jgi:hypothetical protein
MIGRKSRTLKERLPRVGQQEPKEEGHERTHLAESKEAVARQLNYLPA